MGHQAVVVGPTRKSVCLSEFFSSADVHFLSNTGAIAGTYFHYMNSRKLMSPFFFVGGVASGLVAIVSLALFLFFYPRRRGYHSISRARPVNVLHDDEDGNVFPQQLPQYFTPEPYLVPDPTIGGTSGAASTRDRPLSVTTADSPRPQM